jgi:hypothetical protein
MLDVYTIEYNPASLRNVDCERIDVVTLSRPLVEVARTTTLVRRAVTSGLLQRGGFGDTVAARIHHGGAHLVDRVAEATE